jgi:hypothetical protein
MLRVVVLALVAMVMSAQPAGARIGDDDSPDDVRVAGVCGTGAASTLRLKTDDDDIEVRFEVTQRRPGLVWRVALVHERRVVWKGEARANRRNRRSFELRRTLPNLPGADTVTARAWGPRGLACQATATLAEA